MIRGIATPSFMDLALKAAENTGKSGEVPIGCVIVRDNEVIATAGNRTLTDRDPTAHAEMVTIRRAAAVLGRFDLSDCVLYTSCEPCPMCLSAIYWARIPTVFFGCTKEDAADIGFDDQAIYEYIRHPEQHQAELCLISQDREECLRNFEEWRNKADKTMY